VLVVPGAANDWPQWLDPRRSPLPWCFVVGGLTLFVAASIVYRITRGKHLFRPRIPGALFEQRWCSGRSLRSIVTRLGGASGCLWVTVTRDELRVGPHFPFSLGFLPEIYGLDYRFPVRDVEVVEESRGVLGRRRVRVTARLGGDEEVFILQLHDTDGFLRAIHTARGDGGNAGHPATLKDKDGE
jgi:hypothetical protein